MKCSLWRATVLLGRNFPHPTKSQSASIFQAKNTKPTTRHKKHKTLISNATRCSYTHVQFYSTQKRDTLLDVDDENDIERGYLLADEDPNQALNIFNRIIAIDETNERALYGKAVALEKLDRLDEALAYLNRLSTLHPATSISLLRAEINYKLRNFEVARLDLEETVSIYPNNKRAWVLLGHTMSELGREFAAYACICLDRALELDPYDTAVLEALCEYRYRLGAMFFDFTIRDMKRLLAVDPSLEQIWLKLASVYTDIGEYEDALQALDHVLNKDQDSYLALFNKSMVLFRLEQFEPAEQLLLRCFDLKTTNEKQLGKCFELLTLIYTSQGKVEERKKLSQSFVERFPMSVAGWFYLGRAYMTSDMAIAMKYFEQALSIDSNHLRSLDGMGCALFMNGKLDESDKYLQRIFNINYTFEIGETLVEEQLYGQAHALLDHLMQQYPQHVPQLYYSKQFVAARQKDYATEFNYFLKVLQTSESLIDAANYLGMTNNWSGAMKILDELIQQNPRNVHAHIELANLLLEMNEPEDALARITIAEQVNPYESEVVNAKMTALSQIDARLDEAVQLIHMHKDRSTAHMAWSEVHRRRGEFKEALRRWEIGWRLNNPDLPTGGSLVYRYALWRQKAKILESMHDTRAAIDEYSKVLQINPNEMWSLEHLAELYLNCDRVDDALAAVERLLAQRPMHDTGLALKRQILARKKMT